MTLPTIICELALTQPTVVTTWTDVSAYLEAFTTSRGRNHELDEFQAGSARVKLDNSDRRFDPTNAASPYWPNIKPMRRLRLRCAIDGQTYPVFSGYIEDWPQQTEGVNSASVELSVVDGFAALGLAKLNAAFALERSDQRIDAALTAAGWTTGTSWMLGVVGASTLGTTTVLGPVGDRNLSPGRSNVIATTLSDAGALQHIQEVAQAELGWFFVAADGTAVFLSRETLARSPYSVSRATFGDRPDTSELPYVGVTPEYGVTQVWNEVRITAEGGVEQVVQDTGSQADYFKRTLSRTVALTSDNEAHSQASYLLSRYKEPVLRMVRMELDPEGYKPEQVWPQALGRDFGDLITVRFRPVGGGAAIEQESQLHGIEHTFSAEHASWNTVWTVAPRQVGVAWIIGEAALGVGTVPGY